MTKYIKKPIAVEVTQWFKNGDHPLDGSEVIEDNVCKPGFLEGKVVRYYRVPDCDGLDKCKQCKVIHRDHGWVDTLEGGHIVCPGDYIITGIKGENYPCKPDIFEATYEEEVYQEFKIHGDRIIKECVVYPIQHVLDKLNVYEKSLENARHRLYDLSRRQNY